MIGFRSSLDSEHSHNVASQLVDPHTTSEVAIPEKVFVGMVPYKVQLLDEVLLEGRTHFGKIDFRNHVISIWNGLPPERQFVTLLHEVLHAIEADRNIELEESQIDSLAKGLANFLVDNYSVVS